MPVRLVGMVMKVKMRPDGVRVGDSVGECFPLELDLVCLHIVFSISQGEVVFVQPPILPLPGVPGGILLLTWSW